jgi:GxxExxY protein
MEHTKRKIDLLHAEITESIIGAFYLVYNELGYGFLEKVYIEALVRVLRKLGHKVDREILVPVEFSMRSSPCSAWTCSWTTRSW